MADINLVPLEEKAQERIEMMQKRLQLASIGILIVSAVLTLMTLLIFTTSVSRKNDLIAQVEENSSKINQYRLQEELLVVLKDKAAAADSLLLLRVDFNNLFRKMASIIPQGVYFTDMKVADLKVTISGKAKTSADVAGLVSALTSASGAEIINGVSVDSLSSNEFGIYAFVISGKVTVKE